MSATRALGIATFLGGACLVAACSGGIKFNGTDNSTRIQPRTTPIVHFPLPLEIYDPFEGEWNLDRSTLLFGRTVATPKSGQPQFSEPVTAALPVDTAGFAYKQGTDIWEITSDADNNNSGSPDVFETVNGVTNLGGAMSVLCQWLVQGVDGKVRTDTPIDFNNVQLESISVSIWAAGAAGTGAANSTNDGVQHPVDSKIGVVGSADPTKTVFTSNKNADKSPTTVPGRSNEISFGFSAAPAPLTYACWREAQQENLFIENNANIVTDAPSSGYFTASKTLTTFGGIFPGKCVVPFVPTYDPNITDIAWYQIGVVMGQVFGLGVGLPLTAFTRPGIASREEDIMDIAVQTDQIFFQSAGRRFQYPPEDLMIMHNTSVFPIGSEKRLNADLLSLSNPFGLGGTRMRETCPGPKR